MRGVSRFAQRHQVRPPLAFGNRVWYIAERLRLLTDRNQRDDVVRECVNGGDRVLVLQPDINSPAVARGPDAVRQIAGGNCGDLLRIMAASMDFDLVLPPTVT